MKISTGPLSVHSA